ncbi:MAG TPA: ferrochelatase, partial [Steroidobacteraceae bacterium]|nr:ferrochelatase [Steroidobacteraceae bacterium]
MLGVLLVNTGTPEAPQAREVRRFLARFLSDPRVVELPRFLWRPLLHGLVLPLRAPRSARKYRRIWMDDGSPLEVFSKRLRHAVELELEAQLPGAVTIENAFLYSEPTVDAAMQGLRAAGAQRMVILPLFPQGSGTTTGAVFDHIGASLRSWRLLPELHLIANYHDDTGYIRSLANSVREHWQKHGRTAQLLMSFHGIPQRCISRGDAYEQQCQQTARLLAVALELSAQEWSLSFQSRFG